VNGKGTQANVRLHLYENEEVMMPKWLVHPEHDTNVDVVAIHLEKSNSLLYYPINSGDFEEEILPEMG